MSRLGGTNVATALVKAPDTLQGTNDWFGLQERERLAVLTALRKVYESYGFESLSTPAMEFLRSLYHENSEASNKVFEARIVRRELIWNPQKVGVKDFPTSEKKESPENELFRLRSENDEFKRRDHEPVALRFDHTVPLARFAAQHINEIVLPWRRYAFGPVWRAEKPQKGRFREFWQCDFDTVGASSSVTDAEVVAILCSVADAMGMERYSAIFNDRRLLNALAKEIGAVNETQVTEVLRSWDKIDKPQFKNAPKALVDVGFNQHELDRFEAITRELRQLRGSNEARVAALRKMFAANLSVQESLDLIMQTLELAAVYSHTNSRLIFRPFLARGLTYYTGPVFEMVASGSRNSFAGGGRFDNLIEKLGGPSLPATGASFGLERFVEQVREHGTLLNCLTGNEVYVTLFNQEPGSLSASIAVAQLARSAGFRVEMYSGEESLGRQLTIANRKGCRIVLIVGPSERTDSAVTVKDMRAEYDPSAPSNQSRVSLCDLETTLKSLLL